MVAPAACRLGLVTEMRQRWFIHGVLLVIIGSVSALLYWRPPSSGTMPALTSIQPAQVRQLKLRWPGGQPVVLEQHNQQWRMTAPWQAPVDAFPVLRLLTVLSAIPRAQLNAASPQQYGLQTPIAELAVDGLSFRFGNINAVTQEQYLQFRNNIYAIDLRHGAALPKDPAVLLRRRLLAAEEEPIAMELPGFSIDKQDGRWRLQPVIDGIGQESLQTFIDGWRHGSAGRAEPRGNTAPVDTITVHLRNHAPLRFGILARSPDVVLARDDLGLAFRFSREAGESLLNIKNSNKNN
jgi:hypothetical protein